MSKSTSSAFSSSSNKEFWAHNNTNHKEAVGMILAVGAKIKHILSLDPKAANYEADYNVHINQIVNDIYHCNLAIKPLSSMLGEANYINLYDKVKNYNTIIKIFNDCWLQFPENMQQSLLKDLQFKIDNQKFASLPNFDYQMVYNALTSQTLLKFSSELTTIIGEFAGYDPKSGYPQSDNNAVLTLGSAVVDSDIIG